MRASSLLGIALAACGTGSDAMHEAGELALITNIQDSSAWTVPFGEEPWSQSSDVNINRAIERVQHAIRRDPTSGVPSVKGRGYVATFDGDSLRFSSGAEAPLRTTQISFGDDVAYEQHAVAWSLLGNTAQAKLAPTIVEHYQALADGVEVAWVLRERRAGELTIDVAVEASRPSVRTTDASSSSTVPEPFTRTSEPRRSSMRTDAAGPSTIEIVMERAKLSSTNNIALAILEVGGEPFCFMGITRVLL